MQYSISELQFLRGYQEMHKCGSETLAAGKGVSHQPRLGFAGSYSLHSEPDSLVSRHGIKSPASSQQFILGHAVAAGLRSVVDAADQRQASAAPAPATATHGPSIHGNITSSSAAAASCTDSNINVNISSAPLLQRICTNCGADHSAANTWRAGPAGPPTLCNRCGLQYKRHGAVALDRVSRAASTATPELADVPVAELPAAHPQLARSYSSYSTYVGAPESSAVQLSTTGSVTSTAAAPDAALIASNTYSSLGAAAAPMQPRPGQQANSITAEQSERSGTRRSLRKRKPRVAFGEVDYLERGATTRAKTSLTAAAVTAANGSQTRQYQRQKRARQTGDEGEVLRPCTTTRTRELAPAAAAAAASAAAVSGGILQADSAVPQPGASQEPVSMMAVPNVDMQAEAVRLLSLAAPGPAGFRARKSSRIAQRKARHFEAVTASMAAAAEAEEAAEALLDMAGFCWMEGLVAALGDELDTY